MLDQFINSMKKIFALAALSSTLFSCNNDDDTAAPAEEAFFNFEVGDVWAYKWYTSEAGTLTATNRVDTVKITGTDEFNGKTYFKFQTILYSGGNANATEYDYKRIDDNGYLVDRYERVLHPGTDTDFTDEYPALVNGDTIAYINTQLYPSQLIDVEGTSYSAYNYEGYLTPNSNGTPEGLGFQTVYSPGIGLIKLKARYISSANVFIESHLTYHN